MNIQTEIPGTGTSATSVLGTVKWYDPAKGFGFVVAPGLHADVLIHRHVLEAFGMTSIVEDTKISFHYENTANGVRVSQIISVTPSSACTDTAPAVDAGTICEQAVPVRVKWFDQAKGYGFVNKFGSSEDIFIGRDALNRSAMQMVETGQALCVQVAELEAKKRVHCVKDWHDFH